MIYDDIWTGVFLIDTFGATSEAFGTDVRIVGWKDASDLSTTTWLESQNSRYEQMVETI